MEATLLTDEFSDVHFGGEVVGAAGVKCSVTRCVGVNGLWTLKVIVLVFIAVSTQMV